MSSVKNILDSKKSSVVYTIHPSCTAYEAIQLMTEKNISALVVIEDGEIVGIINERDCLKGAVLKNLSAHETYVSSVMASVVPYVTPDESADDCMRLMTDLRTRHLPVIDDGNLLGIISIGDIVNAIVSDREFIIEQLACYITGSNKVDAKQLWN